MKVAAHANVILTGQSAVFKLPQSGYNGRPEAMFYTVTVVDGTIDAAVH